MASLAGTHLSVQGDALIQHCCPAARHCEACPLLRCLKRHQLPRLQDLDPLAMTLHACHVPQLRDCAAAQ